MSKTTGNVVNPLDLIDDVGVDGFRYYVLADTNYGNDGDFSYEGLLSRYNSDLANNFGNLAARVATVVEKNVVASGQFRLPRARSRRSRRKASATRFANGTTCNQVVHLMPLGR